MHNAIAVLYHENRCERWGGVKGKAGGQWYKVWVGFGYWFWSEGSQMGHIHMKIGTWVPYLTGSPKFYDTGVLGLVYPWMHALNTTTGTMIYQI